MDRRAFISVAAAAVPLGSVAMATQVKGADERAVPPEFQYYPSSDEVDAWVDALWRDSEGVPCSGEKVASPAASNGLDVRHHPKDTFVRFSPESETLPPFYGFWEPAPSGPAPLIVHLPGYGAELSKIPELVSDGFNFLHVSPLGYNTPGGTDQTKMKDGSWPVLPDSLRSRAKAGYHDWLLEAALAVRWAQSQPSVLPGRVSFIGTSQGGGTALLMGSLFKDHGVRAVCADLPFLTNYPLAQKRGAYSLLEPGWRDVEDKAAGWRALGFVDTLSHAHRLKVPVLLTGGTTDEATPLDTIETLFARLPRTRSLTILHGQGHEHTQAMLPLARAWFRLYA